ncbi:hypothetical protein KUTeg_021882 [Tegillarca granosa]|uniref:Thyroglobulin type-1 domain-containing protein n=1 Tax=Tegillarca granosa TaxID=220873 RepID=A0ABQ9E4L8_TEGGR|nr:hypothetical protein KUTeg_021882 [Tegillarca granosa]
MSYPYFAGITNMADDLMDHIDNETKGAQKMNAGMASISDQCNQKPVSGKKTIDMPEGPFVPNCTTTGDFGEKQCHGSLCFCMDSTGDFIDGTVRIGHAICNKTELAMAGGALTCPNGNSPQPCLHQCMKSKCPAHPQATCFADPCSNCTVSFKDKLQKPVTCKEIDPCKLGKPMMMKKYSKYGCSNMQMRFYYDQQTRTCQKFNISYCEKDDKYFKSLYQCQSECTVEDNEMNSVEEQSELLSGSQGSMDDARKPPPTLPTRGDVTPGGGSGNQPLRDDKNQLPMGDENQHSMGDRSQPPMGDASQYSLDESNEGNQGRLPHQCDEHGKFVKQQCDGRGHCWCVDGRGTQNGKKVKVDDMNQDIGCAENRTEMINFTIKFNIPQSMVKKNPQKFTDNVVKKAMEKVPGLKDHFVNAKVEMGDLKVDFDGETFTADPTSVIQSFVFEAQTQTTPKPTPEPPVSKPEPGPDKNTIIIITVVIVDVVAVILVIAVVVETYSGKPNGTCFENPSCDVK